MEFDSVEVGEHAEVEFDSLEVGVGMQRWSLTVSNWVWAVSNWVWACRGGVRQCRMGPDKATFMCAKHRFPS